MNYYIRREYDDDLQHALGEERANHKYIKREKLANGKWKYYYTMEELRADAKNVGNKIGNAVAGAREKVGNAVAGARANASLRKANRDFDKLMKNSVSGNTEPKKFSKENIKDVFEEITNNPKKFKKEIKKGAKKFKKEIKKDVKKFKKGFNKTMDKIGDRIGDGVTGIRDKAGDVLMDMSKAVAPERKLSFKKKSKFEKTMNNIRKKASTGLRKASRAVEPSMIDKADRAWSKGERKAKRTAKNVGRSIENGRERANEVLGQMKADRELKKQTKAQQKTQTKVSPGLTTAAANNEKFQEKAHKRPQEVKTVQENKAKAAAAKQERVTYGSSTSGARDEQRATRQAQMQPIKDARRIEGSSTNAAREEQRKIKARRRY